MGVFLKYPEIELLHRVPDIMQEPEVVVMEKIHGTNVRLGWVDGRFRIGGRNEEFDLETSVPSAGYGFLGWLRTTDLIQKVKDLAESLSAEVIFYGEWFGPGVQKGVIYAQEKQLRIFDVRVNDGLMDWDEVVQFTERVGLKTVPLLYQGKPDREILDGKQSVPSTVAFENGVGMDENIGEGIVVKPSRMHRNLHNDWVIAKHKSPKFSERKSLSEGKPKPATPESAITFIEEFFTPQRLEHVLIDMRASGIDVTAPSTTGQIIRGMYGDVLKESKPEYEQLDEDSRKAVDKHHAGKTKVLLGIWLASQTVTD